MKGLMNMTTIQRVYGKGRYDGVFIGITIALIAYLLVKALLKTNQHQQFA
ncbi:MAG: hypothetical protein K0Q73_8629 [Paenibacillus sp.]|jgi:hypothetical protein|nr:hypothetical protein [Paenibacillus sp.]